MKEAQTISQVLKNLYDLGYVLDFKAEKSGLRACEKNIILSPDNLIVDQIHRFEGETDLDEEAIIFAIRDPKNNLMGTYLVAFGSKMDPLDQAIVHRIWRKP